MTRTLRVFVPVAGDPEAVVARFLGPPDSWIPDARHSGPDRYVVTVAAGGTQRPVEVHVGDPWQLADAWWRSWSWVPLPEPGDPIAVDRLLPSLDAELGLVVGKDRRLTLVLDGRYRPPGGVVGDAVDIIALGRVARRSLEGLLATIARSLNGELPVHADHGAA